MEVRLCAADGVYYTIDVEENATTLALYNKVSDVTGAEVLAFHLVLDDGGRVERQEECLVQDTGLTADTVIQVVPDKKHLALVLLNGGKSNYPINNTRSLESKAERILTSGQFDGSIEHYFDAGVYTYESAFSLFILTKRQQAKVNYKRTPSQEEEVPRRLAGLSYLISCVRNGFGACASCSVPRLKAELTAAFFGSDALFCSLCGYHPLAMFDAVMDEADTLFISPNHRDKLGVTPLMHVVMHVDDFFDESEALYRCKRLLSLGASLDTQDNNGWTAVMWAVEGGFIELAKHLLRCGADIKVKENSSGRAVLHLALTPSGLPCVAEILAKGSDVNAKDSKGFYPLSLAALLPVQFAREAVTLLLRHGADPTIAYPLGESGYPRVVSEALCSQASCRGGVTALPPGAPSPQQQMPPLHGKPCGGGAAVEGSVCGSSPRGVHPEEASAGEQCGGDAAASGGRDVQKKRRRRRKKGGGGGGDESSAAADTDLSAADGGADEGRARRKGKKKRKKKRKQGAEAVTPSVVGSVSACTMPRLPQAGA